LGREAFPGGSLVASPVAKPVPIAIGTAPMPDGWNALGRAAVSAGASGSVTVDAGTEGRAYDLLLGGKAHGRVDVSIDGSQVGSRRNALSPDGDYTPLGAVELEPGEHEVTLTYHGADLHPGSALRARPLGPLALVPVSDREPDTVTVRPDQYRRLCGRRWDWIQAYAK
jgi:hypothetical protein